MRKLGIIAGSGLLPAELVKSCERQGRPYFILGLEGFAEAALVEGKPHKLVRLGAVGDALKTLKKEKVDDVIMAGRVGRPTLASLRPDMTATLMMAKLGSGIFSGDDALLSAIVKIMEGEGFAVVGVADVCADLIAKSGVLGKHKPNKEQQQDVARGMQTVRALGGLDIGQAAIVENGYVLAVEAAEGTEEMIRRASELTQHERGNGVLVKASKPHQDARADLPTIGADTIAQLQKAGFAGIAVEAGGSIILGQPEVLRMADAAGLFVIGAEHG